MPFRRLLLIVPFLAPTALLALPPGPTAPVPSEPDLPDGTDRALKAMAGFRPPQGMKVELFAAEPKVASPVAISLDEKGRVYVAEEYRFNRGTEENRSRGFFLEDDLQVRTLADRLKMYEKWSGKFPGGMGWFTEHADQVRLLEDRTGSGKADRSTVFAGGFNGPLDGLAAGVLARDGDVYLTCIPNLWRLKDAKGAGVADEKQVLLTGFGVSCAFLGHDLHGLVFGPDGKLYFSLGDRGFHVESKEGKTLTGLRTGAVFRCDPDGSHLEVVMRGLRNPQELAFDQYGNLFADDNNCDKGDHARLVYVVEDGDAGWNMAYQTIPQPYLTGPWFAERLWHLPHAGQAAYILPPVGKIGTGPSGFLFTSGTSLAERYRNSFLMCNYAGNGGLESFRVSGKGAGFEIAEYHTFLEHGSFTDAEFGFDGKLYVSDFVGLDWNGGSKGGRIFTVFDPERLKAPVVGETKALFAEGFANRPPAELAQLLGHVDQRVRLRAQWALAAKGKEAVAPFGTVASEGRDQLARLHAIWGLGQVARTASADVLPSLRPLLGDPDAEVRGQAAKVWGDTGSPKPQAADSQARAAPLLARLENESSTRVKFFLAQALGKLMAGAAVGPLFAVLAENKDADPWLRHACVAALARIGDGEAVAARAADPNASVRMAAVLVQRRWADKRIACFLADADPLVRTEAARAIHDLPMDDLYPELAKQLPAVSSLPVGTELDPLARRCISACFCLGGADQATAVLAAASDPRLPLAVRGEAISALREWAEPPPRDRVTGFWRELPKRDPAIVRAVVDSGFEALLAQTSGALQTAAVGLIAPLKLTVDEATFSEWVGDGKRGVPARVAALRVLADRKSKGLPAAVSVALADPAPALRAEARDVLAATDSKRAVGLFAAVLADAAAPVVERQRTVAALVGIKRQPEAAGLLDGLAADLAGGAVAPELRLDVWEAVKSAPNAIRDLHRKKFESSLPPGRPGTFAASLHGGDADRGREIFFNHTAAQCVRCHKVGDAGGTAGPDLTALTARHPTGAREYFLESMLDPNAKIAPGFGSVTLTMADGRHISGTLIAEDAKSITVQTADGKKMTVPLEEVERRTAALSPMPSVERTLTPREVRDLVSFLTTLKGI